MPIKGSQSSGTRAFDYPSTAKQRDGGRFESERFSLTDFLFFDGTPASLVDIDSVHFINISRLQWHPENVQ